MESDPEAANILFQITILVILTLINAFFAGSEMAVVSVNKNKIHRLSEQGNKNAALIERLMKDSTVFLSTIRWPSLWQAFSPVHRRLPVLPRCWRYGWRSGTCPTARPWQALW